jgi:uncharacterized protein (TIGR02996 family)
MKVDLDTLHEAVVKEPAADAPRLAFADACEGDDPERAEFIRLQIGEAAALRERRFEDVRRNFHRLFFLKRKRSDRWIGAIAAHAKFVVFYRGFVEWIQVDAREFLDHADRLFALAPVRRVKLTGSADLITEIAASPHLSRIVDLSVDGMQIGDRGVELIAASPYVHDVVILNLLGTGITPAAVEILAASPNLPALRQVVGMPAGFDETTSSDPMNAWSDDGGHLTVYRAPEAARIEAKYGYKRWLHPIEETGGRGIDKETL